MMKKTNNDQFVKVTALCMAKLVSERRLGERLKEREIVGERETGRERERGEGRQGEKIELVRDRKRKSDNARLTSGYD